MVLNHDSLSLHVAPYRVLGNCLSACFCFPCTENFFLALILGNLTRAGPPVRPTEAVALGSELVGRGVFISAHLLVSIPTLPLPLLELEKEEGGRGNVEGRRLLSLRGEEQRLAHH